MTAAKTASGKGRLGFDYDAAKRGMRMACLFIHFENVGKTLIAGTPPCGAGRGKDGFLISHLPGE